MTDPAAIDASGGGSASGEGEPVTDTDACTQGPGDDAGYGAVIAAHTTTLCLLLDRRGTIVHANAAARGAIPALCRSLAELLPRAEDRERITACVRRAEEGDVEAPLRTIEGLRWHALSVRALRDRGHGATALLSAIDIDARRAAEERARRLAYHDRLTGLPNRVRFMHELETRLLGHADEEDPFGLLIVDLDRFRRINDGLGHEIGDALLRAFAARLTDLAGAGSLVARLGGDEFVVVTAPGVEPERLAQAVLEAAAAPLPVAGKRLHLRPSIGVCRCPEHGRSVGDLMSHADAAMAAAKRERRGYRVFDSAMRRDVHARLLLENDLAQGIRQRQFEAHYQPRVSLRTGRVVGFEALARWRHPERGLLPPSAFIDAAEESGLIVELGTQIMLEAMRQQRSWARAGHDVAVSVNVSARQLAGTELLAVVAENARRAGCDLARIELEITESALIGDAEEVAAVLERITALGVRIAIDDFGTGYSNLAYFRRYPLATLKIDRAFVADRDHARLLEAIIGLGRALDLVLVAEGVETLEQARWLAARGVDEAQGFLYSRPIPSAECTAHLDGRWSPSALPSAA